MSEAQDEEAFAKEGKYQKFQYAVERALKNFELSSQWTDQVSHLTTLHKVLFNKRNNILTLVTVNSYGLYHKCIIQLFN